jgi:biotin carboxyl carrier protein
MDYKISIGKKLQEVEIDSIGGKTSEEYVVAFTKPSAAEKRLTVLKRENDRIILSIEGKVYSVVHVERTRTTVSFVANGQSVISKIGLPSGGTATSSSLVATTNELVASNFPAKVVKLVIKKGDSLKEGDTLVILEAMKMEAQIKAPRDCVVEEVYVKEGDLVERGKTMIKLKFG